MKQKPINDRSPIRVKRESAQRLEDAFVPRDSLNYCLDCWNMWMGMGDRFMNDVGTMKLNVINETSARDISPEDQRAEEEARERRRDMRIGEATNAMINSLKAHHQWAIYKSCGQTRVWRFDKAGYVTHLLLAKLELIEKLKKNLATCSLFD